MKKIFIIYLAGLFCTAKVLGQGIEAELYQYNYTLIHPAFAGSDGQKISILANTVTYDGSFGNSEANTLALMSYENYFDKINSGIAVTGYSERMGPSSFSSLGLSYNYKFRLGESVNLVAGAKVRRHIYSVSYDYFRSIEPSDPLLNPDVSEANWAADFGLLLNIRKFNFGLLANNLFHTNDKIDVVASKNHLDKNYAAIVGTSFRINDHLVSNHSLYIPLETELYRIDLNNTITINNFFVAGFSIEKTQSDIFTRFNTGLQIKDYFQILFLVYSQKRNDFFEPKLRGEVFLGFKF